MSRLSEIFDRLSKPSDRGVERAVRWLSLLAAGAANLIGAVVAFVLAAVILPTNGAGGDAPPVILNLVLVAGYVLLAIPLGMWWALRRLRPGRQWLKEGREPSEAEQRNLLRAPLYTAIAVGALWLLAAALFGSFNAIYSLEVAQRIGVAVALAGLVTTAVAYLLTERLLRPAAARALAARALDRPALPGVTARFLFVWMISSGIPLLGISLVALSALLVGDFNRVELARAALAIAGAAIVSGFVGMLLAARVTADPIVSVRSALGEIERGDLDAEVAVYDGTEVGLLQSGFNRMAQGLRERERVRELFGMHVGEDVARAAMEEDQELGGETRRVAVLFVDMVDSTRIAVERPPAEVVELLNEFFGLVVDVVDEHGGWVNKFEGDAALAVFGAPRSSPTRPIARWRPDGPLRNGWKLRSRPERASGSPSATSSPATSAAIGASSTR